MLPQAEKKSIWRIGHRGFQRKGIENTLASIHAAYAAGADFVEFDVQLTADGIPVLFHDDDLLRLTGRFEPVFALPWETVRSIPLRIQGRNGKDFIPSLDGFLKEFGNRPFYLELKIPQEATDDPAYRSRLIDEILNRLRSAPLEPRTFLASFDGPILEGLAKARCALPLCFIHEDIDSFDHSLERDKEKTILAYHSISFRVFKESGGGFPLRCPAERILVWDVKSDSECDALRRAQVRGVCADDVEMLAKNF